MQCHSIALFRQDKFHADEEAPLLSSSPLVPGNAEAPKSSSASLLFDWGFLFYFMNSDFTTKAGLYKVHIVGLIDPRPKSRGKGKKKQRSSDNGHT